MPSLFSDAREALARTHIDLDAIDTAACDVALAASAAEERDPQSPEAEHLLELHNLLFEVYDRADALAAEIADIVDLTIHLQQGGLSQ